MCHETVRLCLVFVGHIDVGEIQQSLNNLGVKVSMEQASRILQRYVSVCVWKSILLCVYVHVFDSLSLSFPLCVRDVPQHGQGWQQDH